MIRIFRYFLNKNNIITILKLLVSIVDMVIDRFDEDSNIYKIMYNASATAQKILKRLGVNDNPHMTPEECEQCLKCLEEKV